MQFDLKPNHGGPHHHILLGTDVYKRIDDKNGGIVDEYRVVRTRAGYGCNLELCFVRRLQTRIYLDGI